MEIIIEPLTAKAFAPFGEILEAAGTPIKRQSGMCGAIMTLLNWILLMGVRGSVYLMPFDPAL